LIVPEQRVAPGVGDGQGVAVGVEVGVEVGPTLLGSLAGDSGPADSLPGSPWLWRRPDGLGAPPVESLHLTSGADPATQMLVSWFTEGPVRCAAPGCNSARRPVVRSLGGRRRPHLRL